MYFPSMTLDPLARRYGHRVGPCQRCRKGPGSKHSALEYVKMRDGAQGHPRERVLARLSLHVARLRVPSSRQP